MMEEKESVSRVKKSYGSYKFRVEGYSAISTKVGESFESPEFSLCGHYWQLRIFPGGSLENHKGYVSFYLASKSTSMARANYKLMILSQVLGCVDEIFTSTSVRTFEPKGVQVDGWGRDKFISVTNVMNSNNGFVFNDSIIFKVEICVIGELELDTSIQKSNQNDDLQTIETCLKDMLQDHSFTDITIILSNQIIRAHKCILAARSPVFKAMLTSAMIESQSSIIHIDDIDPMIMKEIIHFLYTDNLSNLSLLHDYAEDIFCAANKYQIVGLIILTENFIGKSLHMNNIFEILVLGDRYGSLSIKNKCFQFISQNHLAIKQIKDLDLCDDNLNREVQTVLDAAWKRKIGGHGMESEKRFGSVCNLM